MEAVDKKNDADPQVPVKKAESQMSNAGQSEEEESDSIVQVPLARIEAQSVTLEEYYRLQREAERGNYQGGPCERTAPIKQEPVDTHSNKQDPPSEDDSYHSSNEVFNTRQPQSDDENTDGREKSAEEKTG